MGRRLRRGAVVLAGLVLLLLAARQAVPRYGAYRLVKGKAALRERTGSLDPASLRLPDVPDEDNSAYWILQAASAAGLDRDNPVNPFEGASRPARQWSIEDRARLGDVVARNAEALELLTRAAAAPASTFDIAYEQGALAEMPDWLAVLRAARLEEAAAKSALLAGENDGLLAAVRAHDAIAAAVCREPILIAALVGSGVERSSLRVVADLLEAGTADRSLLTALRTLVVNSPCSSSLERSFRGDTLFFAHRFPAWEFLGADTTEPLAATLWRDFLWEPFYDWSEAAFMEARVRDLDALDLPWSEYLKLQGSDALKPRPRFITSFHDMFTPNLVAIVGNLKAAATSRELAIVALEVAIRRLESGVFPSSLELSKTAYAGEIPVYTVHGDWAEVAAPESEELYEEQRPELKESWQTLFRWRVPAPANSEPQQRRPPVEPCPEGG